MHAFMLACAEGGSDCTCAILLVSPPPLEQHADHSSLMAQAVPFLSALVGAVYVGDREDCEDGR
jgi:hypothetical protein